MPLPLPPESPITALAFHALLLARAGRIVEAWAVVGEMMCAIALGGAGRARA